MKHPSQLTKDEADAIYAKIDELHTLYKDIYGAEHDVIVVAHPHHAKRAQCPGVSIMSSGELMPVPAHNIMMQAVILLEGAIIQASQDESNELPPRGTLLN